MDEYEEVLSLRVVIDPAWKSSISPHRVITKHGESRPMTLTEVEKELEFKVQGLKYDIAAGLRAGRFR